MAASVLPQIIVRWLYTGYYILWYIFFPDIESDAKFLLIVEKDAIFQKLLDSDFLKKFPPSILITVSHDKNVLSRASELGSPTNPPWAPGSDMTRGLGSFGQFTGGLYS